MLSWPRKGANPVLVQDAMLSRKNLYFQEHYSAGTLIDLCASRNGVAYPVSQYLQQLFTTRAGCYTWYP